MRMWMSVSAVTSYSQPGAEGGATGGIWGTTEAADPPRTRYAVAWYKKVNKPEYSYAIISNTPQSPFMNKNPDNCHQR